jgi:hypothetical protein
VEEVGKDGRLVLAINAIGNEDTDGDISVSGSFDKTLQADIARVKWFLNHDKDMLLGVPIEGREEDGLVKMTAQLNMKKQISRDVLSDYELYAEHGKTLEHSVGVEEVVRSKANPKEVIEWKLWEFSTLTHWGANENTPLLDLKSMTLKEHVSFLEKAIQKSGYTQQRLKSMEESLILLRKAVGGSLIVECPCCGFRFDYNTLPQQSLDKRISDALHEHANWTLEDVLWEELKPLDEEVRAVVQSAVMSRKALKHKAMSAVKIENLFNYVCCPKCYCRVYKDDAIVEKSRKSGAGILSKIAKKI